MQIEPSLNHPNNQDNVSNSLNSQNLIPTENNSNKKNRIFLKVLPIILAIAVSIPTGIIIGNNSSTLKSKSLQKQPTSENNPSKEEPKVEIINSSDESSKNQQFNWETIDNGLLKLAPSYIELNKQPNLPLSCLNLDKSEGYYANFTIKYEMIEPSITDDKNLVEGLKEIENHNYNSKATDKNDSTTKVKQKFNINYRAICRVGNSNPEYLVLFFTNPDRSSLSSKFLKPVYAAGGSVGDTNFATINTEGKETKIYENFAWSENNKFIDLSVDNEGKELLRFQAYYGCSNIPLVTEENIVISCSTNMYAMNIEDETFEELAICTNEFADQKTIKERCFDKTGSEYYTLEY